MIKMRKQSIATLKKSGRINRILMTGSNGQLGQSLQPVLDQIYGFNNVVYTDIQQNSLSKAINYKKIDVNDRDSINDLVNDFRPDQVIHLAAILSANGEKNKQLCYKVNIDGFKNVIDICAEQNIKMFSPSTIAAFGPETPKMSTPNQTIMRPSTMYGSTKVFNELLGQYYKQQMDLDFRSLRYPQVVSTNIPHGGTGDYSTEIFYGAVKDKHYTCYLQKNQFMPMIYIDDLIEGTIKYLETEPEKLSQSVYNIQGCFFSPYVLYKEIQKVIPEFTMDYKIDFRQKIAEGWPSSLDDSLATEDWGWNPQYDIQKLSQQMLYLINGIVNSKQFKDSEQVDNQIVIEKNEQSQSEEQETLEDVKKQFIVM